MDSTGLYNRIYGWIESVLNPPSVSPANRVSIGISDEDFAALKKDVPYIAIGYTPAILTPIGNGGTRLPIQEKNTNGVFETGDTEGNLANFYIITDGSFDIEVDGEAAVTISNLDFTEALSMSKVASILQAEIIAAVGADRVTVDFFRGDKNYFLFTSLLEGSVSSVVISSSGSGTDITGSSYLNGGVSTPGVDDTDTEQIYLTDYEGDVEIRQVYGEGELLQKLVNTTWLPSVIAYFKKNNFSLNEMGPIQGLPFREGHKTIKESMMTCKFSFFGVAREDVYTIENVGINGTMVNEDSSRSHEISIGG